MMDIKQTVKLAFLENKSAIIASALIFMISLILGYAFEPYLHSYLNPIVEDLTQKVQSGVIKLTFEDIFLNNIIVVCQMFIYGLILCIGTLVLAFNGFFVGYYVATAPSLLGVSVFIVPHGIFEFTSCILACSSGLVLFNFACRLVKTYIDEKEMRFKNRLFYSYESNFDKLVQAFILLAFSAILMAIAGFVEVYVTLPLGEFLLSVLS